MTATGFTMDATVVRGGTRHDGRLNERALALVAGLFTLGSAFLMVASLAQWGAEDALPWCPEEDTVPSERACVFDNTNGADWISLPDGSMIYLEGN